MNKTNTNTSNLIYTSNFDVNMKITDNDKEEMCNIIKTMSKEHHMYIYFNILHDLEKSICTTTSDVTLFDLNDLENNQKEFYKLYEYVMLYKEDSIRQSKIANYKVEHSEVIKRLDEKLKSKENVDNKNKDDYIQLDWNARKIF